MRYSYIFTQLAFASVAISAAIPTVGGAAEGYGAAQGNVGAGASSPVPVYGNAGNQTSPAAGSAGYGKGGRS